MRRSITSLVFALGTALAAGEALAEIPGPCPGSAWHPRPDVGPLDSALTREGEASTPAGSFGRGEVAGTMPFAYRRTGVLTKDVMPKTFYVRGVQAPAGAHGFYVGTYVIPGVWPLSRTLSSELWCFDTGPVGGRTGGTCFMLYSQSKAPAGGIYRNNNPYWINPDVAGNPNEISYTALPEIQEGPVEITAHRTLEYRFLGWAGDDARVEFLVGDRPVVQRTVKAESDRSVRLGLLDGGFLRLTRDGVDPTRARSEFIPHGGVCDAAHWEKSITVVVPSGR